MDGRQKEIIREEESRTHDYLTECRHIEDKQDSLKKQRSMLQEIEEQLIQSTSKAYEYYEGYAHSNDLRLYQIMNTSQSMLYAVQAKTKQQFSGYQEELAAEERKLSLEREELDKQYKNHSQKQKHDPTSTKDEPSSNNYKR